MASRDVVRGFGFGRAAFGVAMLVAPRRLATAWLGSSADIPASSVMIRALAARDLLLGMMLVHVADNEDVARRWTAACGACDFVDGAATLAVHPPGAGRLVGPFALASAAAHAAVSRT